MMNKVILEGRLGKDPEHRLTTNGSSMAKTTLATSNDYKSKSGEWVKKDPYWHDLVAFGEAAQQLAMFSRGDKVTVEGKITYREWTDKAGNKRKATEIAVFRASADGGSQVPPTVRNVPVPQDDDDVPF
jgi:single-strand DNA-binding protein